MQQVIQEIQPGMTELQMVGVAQRVIYENGAEYEGLPMTFSPSPLPDMLFHGLRTGNSRRMISYN